MTDGSSAHNDRVTWLGLNAYGVFIGVLCILVGLRYLFSPDGWLVTGAGHVGYLGSGIALIYSYARGRVDFEVYGSAVLFLSNVLVLIGRTMDQGLDFYNTILTVALGLLVGARIAALMRGGTFVLPRWEK